MSIVEAIDHAIRDIEARHDVRVLFAAESGSRAWGFASPDSDYDVRFIYVHRPAWYLSVGEPRDVIEAMLPNDLDLSGWELRKTLRLFLRCNLALNEWLGSPIIYAEHGPLARQLRERVPTGFRAPAAYHHYLRMAEIVFAEHLAEDPVRLKKVFYVLRPLLACRWIRATSAQPPTEFARMLSAPWVSDGEREMVAGLAAAKADASESFRTPLMPATRDWFVRELSVARAAAAAIRSSASLETTTLDQMMRDTVSATWD